MDFEGSKEDAVRGCGAAANFGVVSTADSELFKGDDVDGYALGQESGKGVRFFFGGD